jgi:histidine triad (HIT) family protein
MDSCIFCRIIKGEISCLKIYEDEYTLAFLDTAGDVDGHILVVPKGHYDNILDCDRTVLYRVVDTVKLISNHLVDDCGYQGVNLLNASNESAGQSVQHFHIHIIPRKINDGIDAWPEFHGAVHKPEKICEQISLL